MRPISGLTTPETTKPNENAPAVTPRSQPNSSRIGGKNSENAVRALTPIAMVTNVTATMIHRPSPHRLHRLVSYVARA